MEEHVRLVPVIRGVQEAMAEAEAEERPEEAEERQLRERPIMVHLEQQQPD